MDNGKWMKNGSGRWVYEYATAGGIKIPAPPANIAARHAAEMATRGLRDGYPRPALLSEGFDPEAHLARYRRDMAALGLEIP